MAMTPVHPGRENHDGGADTVWISNQLPKHDDISAASLAFYFLCVSVAIALTIWNCARLCMAVDQFHWLLPLAAFAGMVAADFVSGLVHWTADSWGSITLPVIGRRFLHPFRVHHVNPHDFLRRPFLVTNGDVAMMLIPFLLATLAIPVSHPALLLLVAFLTAFCVAGLPTNQVHQWAHMPNPPYLVGFLQKTGIILSSKAHAKHHLHPHVDHYCIALGWCNPLLLKIGFWRHLERLMTRLTGAKPRADEEKFGEEVRRSINFGAEGGGSNGG